MSYWTTFFHHLGVGNFHSCWKAENSILQLLITTHFSMKREKFSLQQPGQKFFPSHDSREKKKFRCFLCNDHSPSLSHTCSAYISVKRYVCPTTRMVQVCRFSCATCSQALAPRTLVLILS